MKPLDQIDHRPYPMPKRPWVGHMAWNHLLFAHWPVDPDIIRPMIPAGLTLETYDGSAWIGVVPFLMTETRPRFSPNIPGFSTFPELNVRTYVTAEGQTGVWFFSLDAANALAVWGARTFFHLPYFNARMQETKRADGVIDYKSLRTHRNAQVGEFRGTYHPTGDVYYSKPNTLEHFLTERYCLYSAKGNKLFRGHIHHLPWPLQPAACSIDVNTMAQADGITLPAVSPLLHYVEYIEVLVWNLERVGK